MRIALSRDCGPRENVGIVVTRIANQLFSYLNYSTSL